MFNLESDKYIHNDEKAVKYGSSAPTDAIDNIKVGEHIVHFYEDSEYAKDIQFRFIKNGLTKGERCIYLLHENDDTKKIEQEMIDYGISVEESKNKNLLYQVRIPSIHEGIDNILKSVLERFKEITNDMTLPWRSVGRIVNEVDTEEKINLELSLEKYFQQNIENFNGIVLCPYALSHLPEDKRGKWMTDIMHNHHTAIFSSTPEKGMVFNMQ